MKILLAVDGSDSGLTAVEEAARTPWPEGSVVRIASAVNVPTQTTPWPTPMPSDSDEEWTRVFEERAVAGLTEAAARFGEVAGAKTDVSTKTLTGDPKIAILDEAERWGADLIVIGTHGYNAVERVWMGSVSRAVVTQAKCSVEIARRSKTRGAGAAAGRILLAVDGSECGDVAAQEIAALPWPPETEIHVISVVQTPFPLGADARTAPEGFYFDIEKAGLEWASAAINGALSRFREGDSSRDVPLTVTSEVIVGHPERAIIDAAKRWRASLIALGSHGYHGFKRFLLGSVSQAVASHAPCSVLIIRDQKSKGGREKP